MASITIDLAILVLSRDNIHCGFRSASRVQKKIPRRNGADGICCHVMKPLSKPMTQVELAQLCGVSRSTVAAVIRNGAEAKRLRPELRQRIQETLRLHQYRPHAASHAMRSGRSHTIAFAIPDMATFRGPIHIDIFIGIGEQAQALGYNVLLCAYQDGPKIKASFRQLYQESRFDGVLFYGMDVDVFEEWLSGMEKPYVVLEHPSARSPSLGFDTVMGAAMATRHLLAHGRRRIAFLGSSPVSNYAAREAGYRQALQENGLAADTALIQPLFVASPLTQFTDTGYHGVTALLKKRIPFDAVFCLTDTTALAAIQALHQHDLRVPEDVAVIGFDDSPPAALSSPALTTVRQDGNLLGSRAMILLNQLLKGAPPPAAPVILPCNLVTRQSCGCPWRIPPAIG